MKTTYPKTNSPVCPQVPTNQVANTFELRCFTTQLPCPDDLFYNLQIAKSNSDYFSIKL